MKKKDIFLKKIFYITLILRKGTSNRDIRKCLFKQYMCGGRQGHSVGESQREERDRREKDRDRDKETERPID